MKGKVIIAIWIHVDDGIISSNCSEAIWNYKKRLFSRLDVKWKDSVSEIVGLECVFGEGEVAITQQFLTNDFLDSYPWTVIHHDTPLPPSPAAGLGQDAAITNSIPYWSVISSLSFVVSGSRQDLAFAVFFLMRKSMGPMQHQWLLLDHLVRYLLKTHNMSIISKHGLLSLSL
ncbi:hypothetical protein O181_025119 [Austropuccinia psidii MF-1]|uniref:Reverse transcriptase Ty1/copia-type domain-containing protein n=1 Tax=Austropuccinia psidii MF-1 TaxID=1389203 RepID=A0A9Q3CJY0_9BASI|nr:hypothetical protein [Austropuccinia psidii MF-1]